MPAMALTSSLTPTTIALILAVIFFLSTWVLIFIIFYHLIRFGIGTQPKKIAAVFILGSVVQFFITAVFVLSIDLDKTGATIGELFRALLTFRYI